MSSSSIRKANCPQCGNTQDFEAWDSANVTLNPFLKEKILTRDIMLFKCDSCGHKVETVYPLLYHDLDKKILIWLVPENEFNEGQFEKIAISNRERLGILYQYRIVFSLDDLIEKILIFDEGFDDIVMEIFKARILTKGFVDGSKLVESESFFSGCVSMKNGEKAIIINIINNGTLSENAYPLDAFVNMAKEISPKLIQKENATKWLRVDRNTVINYLETLNNKEYDTEIINDIKQIEEIAKDHIDEMGFKIQKLKIVTVIDMGNDNDVFCFLYSLDQFIGAYFLCHSVQRFVMYDTAEDMKKFKIFLKMKEEQKKAWIREIFLELANFDLILDKEI